MLIISYAARLGKQICPEFLLFYSFFAAAGLWRALLAAGVAANIRAERLTLEQLAALAGALGESLPLASRGKTV